MFGEEIPYEVEENNRTKAEKKAIWEIAIGLQKTDGLTPSEYLVQLANENINGEKCYHQIKEDLYDYYSENGCTSRTREADFSSLKINEILNSDSFTFSPATLLEYHRQLFEDVEGFDFPVGKFRGENLTKKQEVLGGQTVTYSDYNSIKRILTWDFEQEKEVDYKNMSEKAIVNKAMNFISNVWQVHPFREGNTRTCAVFAIKYLRTLGIDTDNVPFRENSEYFRDALVLNNAPLKLQTGEFLQKFSENAFLGANHNLDKAEMLRHFAGILGGKQEAYTDDKEESTEKYDQNLEKEEV